MGLPLKSWEIHPKKKPKLSVSEVITLMILFHHSGYRTMKAFYTNYAKVHMRHLFPKTVSYNRYVELKASANLPLAMFVNTCWQGLPLIPSFPKSRPSNTIPSIQTN